MNNKSIAILVVALVYIISPVDFIPDVIPIVGWIDDVLVGGMALTMMLKNER